MTLRHFALLLAFLLAPAMSVLADDLAEEMIPPPLDLDVRGTSLLWAGSPSKQAVALTFDDGPLPGKTEAILSLLKENQIRATFFSIGEKVDAHPELLRLVVADGHEIGNHSQTHKKLTSAGSAEAMREIKRCQESIFVALGFRPQLFRPPYGAANMTTLSVLSHLGLSAVFWSIDTNDWKAKSAEQVENSVLDNVKNGDVILFHEHASHTLAALPRIISAIRDRGLAFETVSELFDRVPPGTQPVMALASAGPLPQAQQPKDDSANLAPEPAVAEKPMDQPLSAASQVVSGPPASPVMPLPTAAEAIPLPLADAPPPVQAIELPHEGSQAPVPPLQPSMTPLPTETSTTVPPAPTETQTETPPPTATPTALPLIAQPAPQQEPPTVQTASVSSNDWLFSAPDLSEPTAPQTTVIEDPPKPSPAPQTPPATAPPKHTPKPGAAAAATSHTPPAGSQPAPGSKNGLPSPPSVLTAGQGRTESPAPPEPLKPLGEPPKPEMTAAPAVAATNPPESGVTEAGDPRRVRRLMPVTKFKEKLTVPVEPVSTESGSALPRPYPSSVRLQPKPEKERPRPEGGWGYAARHTATLKTVP